MNSAVLDKQNASWNVSQAVEELNIKPKYWKDLIDDTPFTRKDIIHLQDPLNLEVEPYLQECWDTLAFLSARSCFTDVSPAEAAYLKTWEQCEQD